MGCRCNGAIFDLSRGLCFVYINAHTVAEDILTDAVYGSSGNGTWQQTPPTSVRSTGAYLLNTTPRMSVWLLPVELTFTLRKAPEVISTGALVFSGVARARRAGRHAPPITENLEVTEQRTNNWLPGELAAWWIYWQIKEDIGMPM